MAEEGKKRPAGAGAEEPLQPPRKAPRGENEAKASLDQVEWLQKTAEEIRQFGVDKVSSWVRAALEEEGDSEDAPEIADTLQVQKVRGRALLDLTYQQLVDKPYNIAAGPAGNLAKRIAAVSAPATAASGFQDDPDATEFIQELAEAEPQDLGAGVQVFNLTKSLPVEPYDQSGPKLLTRNTTRQAWKATFELMKGGTKRVAMLGVPGIGKSRNLALGLWHLVQHPHKLPDGIPPPEAIVYEAREGGAVFLFTKGQDRKWKAQRLAMSEWAADACLYLKDSSNWYLVDASERTTTLKLPAKTVLACSPDRHHYSNFVKDGGQCVFVEAFSWAEVKACHSQLETQVDEEEMCRRFKQVGGALRTLLADKGIYDDAVELQRSEAEDFTTVRRAFEGDLNTFEGKQMPTRLFTYRSVDGISRKVTVCSPGAAALLVEKHHDKLVPLWSDARNPTSRYWLEEFVGPLLTTFWPGKKGLTAFQVTNTAPAAARKAQWQREQVKDFEVKKGLQLLECDTEKIFDGRWRKAVKKGSLEGLLHSPECYPGIDYLLDFNHGISVTSSASHSIAPEFRTKLEQMFESHSSTEENRSFTLTFLITGEPQEFAPKGDDFNALMGMAGEGKSFDNVCVQVVRIPKTLHSLS
ncbi:unnamed protein product [Symbiodinium sp. CCMP2592]|nr:unnamed protein product [Symbiodinium sp. CCMP2592]